MVNKYLVNMFFIIENNSKQVIILLNDMKLIIHAIEKLEINSVMKKNTTISSVETNIKKLHIHSDLHVIYKQNVYYDKQD